MPITSDIILDWIHDDGYSIAESGWVRVLDSKFYFEVTADKHGHRHIARAPDREATVVHLGMLLGYELDE